MVKFKLVEEEKFSKEACCASETLPKIKVDPKFEKQIQEARQNVKIDPQFAEGFNDEDSGVDEQENTNVNEVHTQEKIFSDKLLARLEHQQYRIIGNHSAVKTCGWTKNSIRDKGTCYKHKFYGIRSHRCVQMTTYLTCANFCNFCWRDITAPPHTEFKGVPDEPEMIIEKAIEEQKNLLVGFKGYDGANKQKYVESNFPKHFAISLTGEPVLYPLLPKMLEYVHSKGSTTYVVCSGQFPEQMSKITPTQLYLSVDAPNEELFYKIDRPTTDNGWGRLMQSLDVLREARDRTRTTIRITLVKGHNMIDESGWADLVKRGNPLFLEVKGYVFVGSSRKRLKIENMPSHDEVREFAKKIGKKCGYTFIDEQEASRVVLMMQKDFDGRIMTFED